MLLQRVRISEKEKIMRGENETRESFSLIIFSLSLSHYTELTEERMMRTKERKRREKERKKTGRKKVKKEKEETIALSTCRHVNWHVIDKLSSFSLLSPLFFLFPSLFFHPLSFFNQTGKRNENKREPASISSVFFRLTHHFHLTVIPFFLLFLSFFFLTFSPNYFSLFFLSL